MQPGSAITELVLPGLEGAGAVTQSQPGHWLERGPQKRLMVFSGRSHQGLAERIAEHLGVSPQMARKYVEQGLGHCRRRMAALG